MYTMSDSESDIEKFCYQQHKHQILLVYRIVQFLTTKSIELNDLKRY